MCIRIMTRVWDEGPSDRAELLVLLALADFADENGYCWPSIATISAKVRIPRHPAIRSTSIRPGIP